MIPDTEASVDTLTSSTSPSKTEEETAADGEVFFPASDSELIVDEDESSQLAENNSPPITSFDELPLPPELQSSITAMGWSQPTEVQALCLPHALRGHDIAGFAQTGTGKTGVFLITLAAKLLKTKEASSPTFAPSSSSPVPPAAVIIAPTRELALQIHEETQKLFKSLKLRSTLVFGGVDLDKQMAELKKSPDVIVATPGRLKDFIQRKAINLSAVQTFICDEVDRMFDIGFIDDVEYFLGRVSASSQKLMFSATSNDTLEELCYEYLNEPKFLSVAHQEITPDRITQKAILCSVPYKLRVFIGLLRAHNAQRAIIFTNTKITGSWLHYKLTHNGFETDLITGDLPQKKRISLIRKIKAGKIRYLIATDVASRGLHISGITHVYNFDLPTEPANYIHRIGRTARAGATGSSYSLVCDEYGSHLVGINKLMKTPLSCEWYPEEYQKIKDQAPDPFVNNFGKPRPKELQQRSGASATSASSKRNRRSHQSSSSGRSSQKRGASGAPRDGTRINTRDNTHENKNTRGGGKRPRQDQGQRGGYNRKRPNNRADHPYYKEGSFSRVPSSKKNGQKQNQTSNTVRGSKTTGGTTTKIDKRKNQQNTTQNITQNITQQNTTQNTTNKPEAKKTWLSSFKKTIKKLLN